MRRDDDAFGIVRDDAVEILRVPSFNPQDCKFAGFLGPQRTTETASFRAADSEIQLISDEVGSQKFTLITQLRFLQAQDTLLSPKKGRALFAPARSLLVKV